VEALVSDDGRAQVQRGPLDANPEPIRPAPSEEPPPTAAGREEEWVADHTHATRDARPAMGTPGRPGKWERAKEGARVTLQRSGWADAQWSYLFKRDTSYAPQESAMDPEELADHNARMRRDTPMEPVHGPIIKPPVWTWEVPLYFWTGGIAAGSSFVALACDLAGDEKSARIARRMALAGAAPSPVLLIMDLGRPARFLNMMRIFKPRSPMNLGAWCLVTFSTLGAAAVGLDLVGRHREARVIGGANALVGGYLGSYTGVLLATTAVPLWARSRLFLGPIFVSTATATGAAATRLALVASGLPDGHPTRIALGRVETGAMAAELILSELNHRRLGDLGPALEHGRPGLVFRLAKTLVAGGLLSHLIRKRYGRRVHDVASVMYLLAGLCFRYAWVGAGKLSAGDHVAVAKTARGRATLDDKLRA
jgi:formate-dependent nitrite reductase membrane component NrfD